MKSGVNLLLRAMAAVVIIVIAAVNISAAAESGTESYITAPKKEKVYELVTSDYPDCRAELKINGQSITVKGISKLHKATGVTMVNNTSVSSTFRAEDDGSFSAVINPSKPEGENGSDLIAIELDNGLRMSYIIEYDNGWYFPDNKLSQQYEPVLKSVAETAPKLWAAYVCADLDRYCTENTLNKVKALSDHIVLNIKDDYSKVVAIARWVSENIYYDRDARDNSVTAKTVSIEHVLEERRSVCGGFANLFCALCQAQGIRAINIRGTVTGDDVTYDSLDCGLLNHEWSAVYIDGRWVTIDTVWNTFNYYQNGKYTEGGNYEKYIDPGMLALSFDHCAYIAEERLFFGAAQYFETLDESRTEQTDSTDNSDSKESSDTTSDVQSSVITSEEQNADSQSDSVSDEAEYQQESSPPIIILAFGAIAIISLVCVIVHNIITTKKIR